MARWLWCILLHTLNLAEKKTFASFAIFSFKEPRTCLPKMCPTRQRTPLSFSCQAAGASQSCSALTGAKGFGGDGAISRVAPKGTRKRALSSSPSNSNSSNNVNSNRSNNSNSTSNSNSISNNNNNMNSTDMNRANMKSNTNSAKKFQ